MKHILPTLVGLTVLALAIVSVRFNFKRRKVIRCAQTATDEQLEEIYSLVEMLPSKPRNCAILARTKRRASVNDGLIPVPSFLSPWAGRTLAIDEGKEVSFRFVDTPVSEPVLRGAVYRILLVAQQFNEIDEPFALPDLYQHARKSNSLKFALQAICPDHPIELLCYLLAPGAETFELDMNQARLGGSPSWVQDEEFPHCDDCKKQMTLLLELPGSMLPGKPLPNGTFFFFACPQHPENTNTVAQFS